MATIFFLSLPVFFSEILAILPIMVYNEYILCIYQYNIHFKECTYICQEKLKEPEW